MEAWLHQHFRVTETWAYMSLQMSMSRFQLSWNNVPWTLAVPPDGMTLTWISLRVSTSHFMMAWTEVAWKLCGDVQRRTSQAIGWVNTSVRGSVWYRQ